MRLPDTAIEAVAWKQHQLDGHGYHPDDPHYCWDEHRDEYMDDAQEILTAFCEEMGFEEEQMRPDSRSATQFAPKTRLVSKWRSVDA